MKRVSFAFECPSDWADVWYMLGAIPAWLRYGRHETGVTLATLAVLRREAVEYGRQVTGDLGAKVAFLDGHWCVRGAGPVSLVLPSEAKRWYVQTWHREKYHAQREKAS